MQLHTKTNVFLWGSGALLFVLGGAAAIAFFGVGTIGQYSNVPTIESEDEASENSQSESTYEPLVRTYLSTTSLPEVRKNSSVSLEETLMSRRSRREYSEESLSLSALGQMLFAGQGITNEQGGRTSPSARSVYPMKLYTVVDRVEGLEPGLYEYVPETHALALIRPGDMNSEWEAITAQEHPANAAAVIFVAGNMSEPAVRKLVLQESGHIGQNFYLQAEALNLGMLVMGGFDVEPTRAFLGSDEMEEVLYLVPIGERL